jgi:hypothetical protein
MNRSVGVTVIAILSLIGSAFMLLMGIFMVLAMFFAPTPSGDEVPFSPVIFKVYFLLMALLFMLPAIWGILSGIGLFLLKNWARISTIVFSVLLILISGSQLLFLLMLFFIPFQPDTMHPMTGSVMIVIRIVIAVFALLHLSFGIWWLAFFTRPKVVQQFKRTPLMATAETSVPIGQAMQASAAPGTTVNGNKRPASIIVIACLLLAGCLFMPMNIVLHAPMVLLTKILTGWAAMLVHFIFLAVALFCGIGLLRLKPAALVTTIGYIIFGAVNMTVFYFAPGGSARIRALLNMQQSMFSWIPTWQDQSIVRFDPAPFVIIGIFGSLIALAVEMYFLITRKKAFLAAAAGKQASKTA